MFHTVPPVWSPQTPLWPLNGRFGQFWTLFGHKLGQNGWNKSNISWNELALNPIEQIQAFVFMKQQLRKTSPLKHTVHQAERNTQLSALVPYFLDFVIHLQLQVNVSGVLTRSKMYLNPAHIYTSRASVSNPPILLAKTFAILNYQKIFLFYFEKWKIQQNL